MAVSMLPNLPEPFGTVQTNLRGTMLQIRQIRLLQATPQDVRYLSLYVSIHIHVPPIQARALSKAGYRQTHHSRL